MSRVVDTRPGLRATAFVAFVAFVALGLPCVLPTASHAQEIRGHLLESGSARPIVGGTILLLDPDGATIDWMDADSSGAFALAAPTPGVFFLRARHQGYATRTDGAFELGEGGLLQVEFYLVPAAVPVDGVTVEVEGLDPLLRRLEARVRAQGFFEREEMGLGHHISPREIDEDPPLAHRDLIAGLVGLEATASTIGVISLRSADCRRFSGWVNGVLVFRGDSWDLAQNIHAADVGAMEIYYRSVQTPLQYQTPGTCGAVLIWSK